MRSALGKGLDALISEETVKTVAAQTEKSQDIRQIPIDRIQPNPNQPRMDFRDETLAELSQSIKKSGILQPILVTPTTDDHYEIIVGERRWRAAKQAGLTEMPAIIRSASDAERFQLALIENIQREDLNPMDQAKAFTRLASEFQMTQEDIANVIRKDRAVIANTMRLLSISPAMQATLINGQITASHARALVSIDDIQAREELFKRILDDNLSVRMTEQAVREHKVSVKGHLRTKSTQSKSPEIKSLEDELQKILTRKVELQIAPGNNPRGILKLEFYSLDDLDALIAQLRRLTTTR